MVIFFDKTTQDYDETIVEDIRNRDKLKFIRDIYDKGTKQKYLKNFIISN